MGALAPASRNVNALDEAEVNGALVIAVTHPSWDQARKHNVERDRSTWRSYLQEHRAFDVCFYHFECGDVFGDTFPGPEGGPWRFPVLDTGTRFLGPRGHVRGLCYRCCFSLAHHPSESRGWVLLWGPACVPLHLGWCALWCNHLLLARANTCSRLC